jgi:hypothetical protein
LIWEGSDSRASLSEAAEQQYGALARDGISCTVCHHIAATGLGQERSYTGNFVTGPAHEIFGPYEDTTIVPKPMQHALGITPRFSVDIQVLEKSADGKLRAVVLVTNKVGHYLPSGVGLRRVFLEALVRDAAGNLREMLDSICRRELRKKFHGHQALRGVRGCGKQAFPFDIGILERRTRTVSSHVFIFDTHHHMPCIWTGHGTPEETERLGHDGAIELRLRDLFKLGHEITHASRLHLIDEFHDNGHSYLLSTGESADAVSSAVYWLPSP